MATALSFPGFHQRVGFAIECGTVQLARFQIKLVDHNLNQRRGGNSEKYSEKPGRVRQSPG